jgi:peptidoglycan/LPS O-acetylase OafA/YrhL
MAVGHRLAPLVQATRWPLYPVLLACDAAGTFVAAGLIYVFVERPFMELRPRAARSRAASPVVEAV